MRPFLQAAMLGLNNIEPLCFPLKFNHPILTILPLAWTGTRLVVIKSLARIVVEKNCYFIICSSMEISTY